MAFHQTGSSIFRTGNFSTIDNGLILCSNSNRTLTDGKVSAGIGDGVVIASDQGILLDGISAHILAFNTLQLTGHLIVVYQTLDLIGQCRIGFAVDLANGIGLDGDGLGINGHRTGYIGDLIILRGPAAVGDGVDTHIAVLLIINGQSHSAIQISKGFSVHKTAAYDTMGCRSVTVSDGAVAGGDCQRRLGDFHLYSSLFAVCVVCVTNNIVPNGVCAGILTGGNVFGILAVLRQAVDQLAADGSTSGDQILILAGVGQFVGSRSSFHYGICYLDAPAQLDFAGIVAGTLDSQFISTCFGSLVAADFISNALSNSDGLGLLTAGVGQAAVQLYIVCGNGFGIDGQFCSGIGDGVVITSGQGVLLDGISTHILAFHTLQFTGHLILTHQTVHGVGQFRIGFAVDLADSIRLDGDGLGVDGEVCAGIEDGVIITSSQGVLLDSVSTNIFIGNTLQFTSHLIAAHQAVHGVGQCRISVAVSLALGVCGNLNGLLRNGKLCGCGGFLVQIRCRKDCGDGVGTGIGGNLAVFRAVTVSHRAGAAGNRRIGIFAVSPAFHGHSTGACSLIHGQYRSCAA